MDQMTQQNCQDLSGRNHKPVLPGEKKIHLPNTNENHVFRVLIGFRMFQAILLDLLSTVLFFILLGLKSNNYLIPTCKMKQEIELD